MFRGPDAGDPERSRPFRIEAGNVTNEYRVATWHRTDSEKTLRAQAQHRIDPLRLESVEKVANDSARVGIAELIAKVKPDLVCMATHGRAGIQHVLLGSSGFGRARNTPSGINSCASMAKLEIVVPEAQVGAVKRIVTDKAGTGRAGDGMIYISPVAEAIRIRTAETLT